jgi:hypothetical protein
MSNFAIIDDNQEQSSTLKTALEHYLKQNRSGFNVITQFPFKDLEDYFAFIDQENVCVLILDERLNDQSINDSGPVEYKGNQLVTIIRQRLKDFPVFMVTTHSQDGEVISKFEDFEYIISRQEFIEEGSKFTPIIIRSAQRYLESNAKELSEYDYLTREIAQGNTNPDVIKRLNALQVKLELPTNSFDDRTAWLEEYDTRIKELEKLEAEIKKKLDTK